MTTKEIYDAEATKKDCAEVNSLIVFINGINAPFIQVTKPNMKNNPAIIIIGMSVLSFFVEVSFSVFDIVYFLH